MPASYDYAERLCRRLPRRLRKARENAGLSRYALEKRTGVSRDMIGDIEHGDSIPTLHLAGRLVHGLGMRLWEFIRSLEE